MLIDLNAGTFRPCEFIFPRLRHRSILRSFEQGECCARIHRSVYTGSCWDRWPDLSIENIDAAYPSGTTTFSAVEGKVAAQNGLYVCSSC
mgnify:CR=1 FL=1